MYFFCCCFDKATLCRNTNPLCVHFFVYVSPQTFGEVEAMGSSVPQLLEDLSGDPGRGSPVSNTASANTTNNPDSVGHSTDLQVCLHVFCLFLCWIILLISLSVLLASLDLT